MTTISLFDLSMGTLPTELPVLALPESFLMPEGKLSIRMTDVKQIGLVFFALAHGRVFAVLPKNNQAIGEIGCVARICGFNENDDGSLMVSLLGICRFQTVEHFTKDSNEMVRVNFLKFSQDFETIKMQDENTLLEVLRLYLKNRHIDIDVALFAKMTSRRLLATLVSVLPLDYMEKQAILECTDFNEAAKMLITILNMSLIGENLDKERQKC